MDQTNVNIQQKRKIIDDRKENRIFCRNGVLNLPCERNTDKLKKTLHESIVILSLFNVSSFWCISF
jgi:hypothetical protein